MEKDINKFYYEVNRAQIWVMAIIHKGFQLIELDKTSRYVSSDDVSADFESWNKSKKTNSLIVAETHFFLTSMIKAKQWLDKITRQYSNNDIEIAKKLFEDAHLARNVREHDNEYHVCKSFTDAQIDDIYEKIKKGNKPWYYKAIENIKTHGKNKIYGMLWTGIIGGKYYIGNVDVSKVVSEAQRILPYLDDKDLIKTMYESCHQNKTIKN